METGYHVNICLRLSVADKLHYRLVTITTHFLVTIAAHVLVTIAADILVTIAADILVAITTHILVTISAYMFWLQLPRYATTLVQPSFINKFRLQLRLINSAVLYSAGKGTRLL